MILASPYGGPSQASASWAQSFEKAQEWHLQNLQNWVLEVLGVRVLEILVLSGYSVESM